MSLVLEPDDPGRVTVAGHSDLYSDSVQVTLAYSDAGPRGAPFFTGHRRRVTGPSDPPTTHGEAGLLV